MTTQKVDSIVIVIAKEFYFHSNIQTKTTLNGDHELITETAVDHGITIAINCRRAETRITISSKILGKEFLELIHRDNIYKVHKAIAHYVPLSLEDLMLSVVCIINPTVDVIVENKGQTIADLFDLVGLQTAYNRSPKVYKANGNPTSFWLKKANIDTENIDYLSIYCKFEELTKKSKRGNCAFLESLNPEDRQKALDDSKQLVRFEVKLSSRRLIRKHYGLGDKAIPLLQDILNAEVNVTQNMVERIYQPILTSPLPTQATISMNDLGHYYALEKHNFGIEESLVFLQSIGRVTNKARTRKRLQTLAIAADEDNHNQKKETYQMIIELLTSKGQL